MKRNKIQTSNFIEAENGVAAPNNVVSMEIRQSAARINSPVQLPPVLGYAALPLAVSAVVQLPPAVDYALLQAADTIIGFSGEYLKEKFVKFLSMLRL